jgi:enoyl-CoA hydratase/carnithine racemase
VTGLGETVLLSFCDDGVAIVSLNAPTRINALDLTMRDGLIEAFEAVRDNPAARCLLLRAEGPHFSAGADLRTFGSADTVFEARRIRWDRDPWYLLRSLPQPSVVALHGYTLGSGLEMSLLCDFRLAGGDTIVGLPETKLAMLPAAGGTRSVTSVLRPAAALPFVLTGDLIDAAAAQRLGIVDRVVDDVELETRTVAARLAALPAAAARAAKRAVQASTDLPLRDGLAAERLLSGIIAAV